MGGPRIQVVQPRYGSTAGFRGMSGIPSIIVPLFLSELLFTVIDYLAVGYGSAPAVWVVVPGMYITHLKHR